MTKETVTPEAQAPVTDVTPEPEIEEQPTDKGNKEAAKYRLQLREVEAERDALTEQLALTRSNILNNSLDQAFLNVIKFAKADINEIFSDDGNINEKAVLELGETLDKEYPDIMKRDPNQKLTLFKPLQTRGPVAPVDRTPGQTRPDNWSNAFTPSGH